MEAIFNQSLERFPTGSMEAQRIRVILLIDDSDDDEYFLRRALKNAGIPCQLLWLPGGAEAIEYFARRGPYADKQKYPDCDLVFLDINMPGVSGFDVLRAVRHLPDLIPFIVIMSTSEEGRDIDLAMSLGAISYSSKPPTEKFFEVLRKELGLQWIGPPN